VAAELRSHSLTTGQPIAWPNISRPEAWLYPILDGRSVKEIWVYRVRGNQRQRVEQATIRPIKESFITTPLVGTASQVASVDSDIALTTVKLMPGQSSDMPWLLLEGQRRYGNTIVRYGQILSYQPYSQRLHRLLNWSSSAGQPPQWRHSETGKQLVINQTVGLRPSFLLYQLVPNDPPQLKEISVYRSVYGSQLSTSLYDKALKLAQGDVWSHSFQMMQSAQRSLAEAWSPDAQNQLDLIRLHAERTQAQTKQTWSNQQQHIFTYLIDGQWKKALTVLEENPTIYETTLKRVEQDFAALWRSVTIHLQVHPQDVTTQIWGALLITARQSPEAAEEWLRKKTRSRATLERLRAVGRQPAPPSVHSDSTTAALPATSGSGRYRSLIGQARVIGNPGNEWLQSQTLPTLLPGQTWYQIDVQLLQDGSGWGQPPAPTAAAHFWAESLALRQKIQLFSHSRPVAGLMIQGIKTTSSGLALLAIGPKLEDAGLVTTNQGLHWLKTMPWQPAPAPPVDNAALNDGDAMALPQPHGIDWLITTTIVQQLGLAVEQTTQLYAQLQYASLDLVGDAAPEYIFSIRPGVPSEFSLTPGKAMIFSNTGELLYSDIGQQQFLLALTHKTSNTPVTLLTEQAGYHTLTRL
ncbi:MAG: hypothetical protein F6K31_25420, partial [Symploca sp. SIO2G7]|nr:hypothetical protein [Symploca sp. SIO2G7]